MKKRFPDKQIISVLGEAEAEGIRPLTLPLFHPVAPNLCWSIYFVMDALANGPMIKCLTYVDDFTKDCLTVTVAFRISDVQVTRILDSIALFRGYLVTIRTDQGPNSPAARWSNGLLSMGGAATYPVQQDDTERIY